MRDKAMPLGKKFKVRLTITPEETGTPVDMLGFTFTSGRNGRMELDTEYNNIPKLADDGLDSLSILVILKHWRWGPRRDMSCSSPSLNDFTEADDER